MAWALRLPPGALIRVIRCVWVSSGDPAAVSTAYLHDSSAGEDTEGAGPDQGEGGFGSGPAGLPAAAGGGCLRAVRAAAVSVEMSPPQPSIARSRRLSPGQPVITVTVRFDDAVTGEPAGLTVGMLKPELFRIAIDTAEAPVRTSLLRLAVRNQLPSGHARVPAGTLEPTCRLRS